MAVPSTNGTNGNSSFTSSSTAHETERVPRKLILCFDGTGNKFSGSNADTNVVKILNKFDRHHPEQYHYYQTGIGTYGINETSVNKTWWGGVKSSISKTIDEGVATTFDAHVMAGYRFLMRYHEPNDVIYMFGFSRGAFTAKFLARMIHTVGLLCKGNEEMVPFAYLLYQKYLSAEVDEFVASGSKTAATPSGQHGETTSLCPNKKCEKGHGDDYRSVMNEIKAFGNTFCRKERIPKQTQQAGQEQQYDEENIKVYFLGLWDCVSSVAVLEKQAPLPVPVLGTATFVRHAVAIDERRVKFKPALLAQEPLLSEDVNKDDIKEVWFPGGHCDVGGGYGAKEDNPADYEDQLVRGKGSFWERVKNFWWSRRPSEATESYRNDAFQLSDVPLAWMLNEVDAVGKLDESKKVQWSANYNGFLKSFKEKKKKEQALNGIIHDSLCFGLGSGFFKVLLWRIMEYMPFIKRWELNEDKLWKLRRFPLNKGASRDIPVDAVLHTSVLRRLQEVPSYKPQNNHGDGTSLCFFPVDQADGVSIASYNLESRDSKQDGERAGEDHETLRFVGGKN